MVSAATLAACGSSGSASNDAGAVGTGGAPGGGGAKSSGGATGTGAATSSGGAAATGGSTSSSPPATGESVLMHHKNPNRDGVYVEPALTRTAVANLDQDMAFRPTFGSEAVYAQPLFVDGMGSGKDLVFVATESNDVYAFDASNGAQIWKTPLGAPTPMSMMSCGNIDPFGVTGTSVIDLASRTLFVDGLVLPPGDGAQKHMIFALSIDTGEVRPGWPVDVAAKVGTSAVPFLATTTGQRGALALVGDTLYVPYGGLYGDCGTYNGRVVAVSISDPTQVNSWATSANAGGIWAPAGVSSDGAYVYVATGNTENTKRSGATNVWGGGDALVRLGLGAAFTSTPAYFAPTNWHDLDDADLDMGTAPIPFDLVGSTPTHLALVLGKDGNAYLVDRDNLTGVGKALGASGNSAATLNVSSNVIISAPVLYTTATATYVSFKGQSPKCSKGASLATYKITPGSPPTLSFAWCAGNGGGSPMVTTSDGTRDVIVWFPDADGSGQLEAFDGDTGDAIPYAGSKVGIANVRRFNAPIAAKGKIYVAADGGITAFTL
ncbi:MAG TPA: PQQ-binding-like beta-propeller repeat protein [Polyangiaceae bacterium]|nr:PQQ-binding-like beta-propeller repeat protein [Polyangiaceae bacterium]